MIFALTVATGLRKGEVLALKWEDVDLGKRQLRVKASLQWRDGIGKPHCPSTGDHAMRRIYEKAGLSPKRFHDFRPTAASHMHQNGVKIGVIKSTLGHSRIATTTDIYTHIMEEHKEDAADTMNPLSALT